jgi:asparagine synthase (glutamine-hydrolysing)
MVSTLYPAERERIVQRLGKSLESEDGKPPATEEEFVSAVDEWVTRHRLARFIINAVRVYEYFGLQWRMPLWDNELVEFWYRIPTAPRRKNALYNEYLLNSVFAPLKVNVARPIDSPSRQVFHWFIARAPRVYQGARKTVHRLRGRKSEVETNNGFDALAEMLKGELAGQGIKLDSPDINHYFARWFLLEQNKVN